MKIFALFLSVCTAAWAVNRSVSIGGPDTVYAGQSFLVPAVASTDATNGEQVGFFHAEFSTDGGNTWTGYCYDVNAGTYAARNAWITAGAAGSRVLVRVRIAFRGAGDFDYAGNWIDWGGSWDNWQTPPVVYRTIDVIAPPNRAPTVTWVQQPASAWINDWFSVQARADDADGNLSNIWVWKEWVPFAVNGGGNGWQSYSDANGTSAAAVTNVAFQAQSFDSAGGSSAVIYHTVAVNNRAPVGLSLALSGATLGYNDRYQHYTLIAAETGAPTGAGELEFTSSVRDEDRNLSNHTLRFQRVLGTSAVDSNWIVLGHSTPSDPGASQKKAVFSAANGNRLQSAGRFDFSAFSHDPYTSGGSKAVTLWVYGNSNSAQFVRQSINGVDLSASGSRIELESESQTARAAIRLRNVGTKLWQKVDTTYGTPHQLAAIGNTPLVWGGGAKEMSEAEVVPTGFTGTDLANFEFTFSVPSAPGEYSFQWKMLESGVPGGGFFEAATEPVTVKVLDTSAPSVPTWPADAVSGVGQFQFTVKWNASTDNSGRVAGYRLVLHRTGAPTSTDVQIALEGAALATSYTFTGLQELTNYTVTVQAKDEGREVPPGQTRVPNWSAASSALSVATIFDPLADNDGDGVPNGVERDLGLNWNDPTDVRVFRYDYDNSGRLKSGPGGDYEMDAEGNITGLKPKAN